MNSAIITLISTLVRQLIGSDLWGLIYVAVANQDNEAKSGEAKRKAVRAVVSAIKSTVSTWLVNLAIETAVAKLKIGRQ